MTIHYISKFDPPYHTERYIAEALAWLGYKVECYEFDHDWDRPEKMTAGDIMLTALPQRFGAAQLQAWKDAGVFLATWYFDWIGADGNGYKGRELAYGAKLKLFDAVFSTDGDTDEWYQLRGIKRFWLPQAVPPEDRVIFDPAHERHDLVFLGHRNGQRRCDMLDAVGKRFDLKVCGDYKQPRLWGRAFCSAVQASKIVLGDNYLNHIPRYWSNRVYVVLAAGGFLLTPRVTGLDAQFTDGKHLVMHDGGDDLFRKIEKWLKRPRDRARIAQNGHREVHRNHTYLHRTVELMTTIEGLR